MNFNKLILGGHLGNDIEITRVKEHTPEEFAVGRGSVAVNVSSGKGADGKSKTDVVFVNFTAYGKRAENMAKFFKKGSGILLEGQLRIDQYEDKDGNKKKRTYMLVEKFDFVDKHNANTNTEAESTNSQTFDDDTPY